MYNHWKTRPLRNPILSFAIVYVCLIVLYGLYAWGVSELMGRYILKDKEWDKNNFISLFVVFAGGVVLVLFNREEVEREHTKVQKFLLVIRQYRTLLFTFADHMSAVYKPNDEDACYMVIEQKLLKHHQVLYDTILFILSSLMILYWEQSSSTVNSKEGESVIIAMCQQKATYVETSLNIIRDNWGIESACLLRARMRVDRKSVV